MGLAMLILLKHWMPMPGDTTVPNLISRPRAHQLTHTPLALPTDGRFASPRESEAFVLHRFLFVFAKGLLFLQSRPSRSSLRIRITHYMAAL